MKNYDPRWKKNCLFLLPDEIIEVVKRAYNIVDIVAHFDMDGLWFSSRANYEWDPDDHEICERLSEYFDVNVTSIHIDDCDVPGVWIVYIPRD